MILIPDPGSGSAQDRELGAQLRRALGGVALNLAEASGNQAGNARLRYETALLYEAGAALRVALAWGYVAADVAAPVLESMNVLGGRVFGLSRR